jgi:hypothetical protein
MWIVCGESPEEGVFRTKKSGEHFNLRKRKKEEGTENYTVRSITICALHLMLSSWSQGECDGQDMYHTKRISEIPTEFTLKMQKN